MTDETPQALNLVDTPNRTSVQFGDEVFVPAMFQSDKLYSFKVTDLELLRALGETWPSLDAAAIKCGITTEQALAILRKPDIKEFLENRLKEIAVHRGWTVERWFNQGQQVWSGEKKVSREQIEVWKEFGARVAPKIERVQHEFEADEFVFTVKGKKA